MFYKDIQIQGCSLGRLVVLFSDSIIQILFCPGLPESGKPHILWICKIEAKTDIECLDILIFKFSVKLHQT